MTDTMILIPGRTSRQGTSLNKGKLKEEYIDETSTVEIDVDEMSRMGLNEGDKLRISNHIGEAIVQCKARKAGELPEGMMFIAYGPSSSRLMEADTAGSGMPISKNFEVRVEKITE